MMVVVCGLGTDGRWEEQSLQSCFHRVYYLCNNYIATYAGLFTLAYTYAYVISIAILVKFTYMIDSVYVYTYIYICIYTAIITCFFIPESLIISF